MEFEERKNQLEKEKIDNQNEHILKGKALDNETNKSKNKFEINKIKLEQDSKLELLRTKTQGNKEIAEINSKSYQELEKIKAQSQEKL